MPPHLIWQGWADRRTWPAESLSFACVWASKGKEVSTEWVTDWMNCSARAWPWCIQMYPGIAEWNVMVWSSVMIFAYIRVGFFSVEVWYLSPFCFVTLSKAYSPPAPWVLRLDGHAGAVLSPCRKRNLRVCYIQKDSRQIRGTPELFTVKFGKG